VAFGYPLGTNDSDGIWASDGLLAGNDCGLDSAVRNLNSVDFILESNPFFLFSTRHGFTLVDRGMVVLGGDARRPGRFRRPRTGVLDSVGDVLFCEASSDLEDISGTEFSYGRSSAFSH